MLKYLESRVTEISHQLDSGDIIDIAGILLPQKYLTNLLREISLIIIDYQRLALSVIQLIDYH